jgi:hypothetical protein
MKKLVTLAIYCLLSMVFINSSQAQLLPMDDTRTLQLMYIDCKFAKGKVLGEKIKIEALIDGYEIPMNETQKLKTGNTWGLNINFDFLDYAIIRIYKDNVFSDKLIGEIRVDSSMMDRMDTVNMGMDKVELDVTYKVTPGPGYKEMIMRLRQALTVASREIIELQKVNKRLDSEVGRLRSDNNTLRDRIRRLEKDKK